MEIARSLTALRDLPRFSSQRALLVRALFLHHSSHADLSRYFVADGGTESLGITAGETANPTKNMPRVVKAVFWRYATTPGAACHMPIVFAAELTHSL